MHISLKEDWNASSIQETAYYVANEDEVVFEGNGHVIDGNQFVVHLLKIHNCANVVIRNVRFLNGNTEILKKIPRRKLHFQKKNISIFEFLDGGAVLITGASRVIIENCHFENNHSVMCGGAISNQSTLPVIIKNCTFTANTAGHTGSAIDNLTPDSQLAVTHSTFSANKSNTWHMFGAPHGQISIFPKTRATIVDSIFSKGSIPIDYAESATVSLKGNTYQGYDDWKPAPKTESRKSIIVSIRLIKKLYWVLPKTVGKVFYGVR